MRFDFLLSFVLVLLFQGCFETADKSEKKTLEAARVQPVVHEGVLRINESGENYVLADDALDYRVIQSPDGQWLAVETRLMSNLQIIRAYRKNNQGRYRPLKDPVAVKLWDDLLKEEGFTIDDVNYPRMRFLRWISENSMLINMSGEFHDKVIDRNVTFHFRAKDYNNSKI